MDRDDLLIYLKNLGLVENYTRKLALSNDWEQIDDEIGEIWLQICEIPQEKWDKLLLQGTQSDRFKAVRGFVAGLIHRNIRSTNSKLYYRLKKHQEREILVDDATFKAFEENIPDESEDF